jgi:hypothetical protein
VHGYGPPSWQLLGGGAQKWKGGADPAPNFESGWKKRIWKNTVTSTKKKCVYRLINRLSA